MSSKRYIKLIAITAVLIIAIRGQSQVENRVATTAASFLEIGIGSAGSAMGEAYVSMPRDLTSLYWNPAGLGMMSQNSVMVIHQPWIANTNCTFFAANLVIPSVGTLAAGVTYMGYGTMDVTTVEDPEGTGETFSPSDYAFSLAYSRRLVQWFSFGATFKYVTSQIWHCSASVMAVDLGVLVNTGFFSPTRNREDGMMIGMSISNYGGRMEYDGIDLLSTVDPYPQYEGNFAFNRGKYDLNAWELPLIFRVGLSLHAFKASGQRLTLSADALHPNNNSESVNIGGEYGLRLPGMGELFLRGGYKALFMDKSEYGATFGGGVLIYVTRTSSLQINYAYKSIGILGNMHSYELGINF
ncbi:PorV/PorQ family protein [bacterium]|nr:PorV/PorQ family protein [bacterium]